MTGDINGARPRLDKWGPAPFTLALLELLLDRRQHRLAVGVALLVVAHLAQLGGPEVAEALDDLRGGQVVVAEDRERGADAGGAACPVDLAQHALRGAARGALRTVEQALDV